MRKLDPFDNDELMIKSRIDEKYIIGYIIDCFGMPSARKRKGTWYIWDIYTKDGVCVLSRERISKICYLRYLNEEVGDTVRHRLGVS